MCDEPKLASALDALKRKQAVEPPSTPRLALGLTRFKQAVQLLNEATAGAEDWEDVTFTLENAFQHPLYDTNRTTFALTLAQVVGDGIEIALE